MATELARYIFYRHAADAAFSRRLFYLSHREVAADAQAGTLTAASAALSYFASLPTGRRSAYPPAHRQYLPGYQYRVLPLPCAPRASGVKLQAGFDAGIALKAVNIDALCQLRPAIFRHQCVE